ncbi:uncharacterized protein LOC133370900 [Rhineura floridana]|uniref:uncharacterized protein LOC133370900 n=1 Tax=Rhineura floridana TaxID=261503 RepID=UPI002AC7F4C6|nr:uncharacterized protein LOC133370900 [Rhineura floridana]
MEPGRFLIFMFAAGTVHSAKESLEIIPSNGDVQLGKPKYFLCKVRAGGDAALTWNDPEDVEIEDSELYKVKAIDEQSKGMEITLSDKEKGGIFTCKGDFDSGETATAQIRIRVVQSPTFVTRLDPTKEVVECTRANFNCQATEIPQGSYSVSPRIELPTGESFPIQIGNPTQYNFTILASPSPSVSIAWKGKVFEGDDIKKLAQDRDRYTYSFAFTPTSQKDISELLITATNDLGTTEKKVTLQGDKGMGIGSILAIVLVILLALLLVMDVFCYYKRQRGLLMYCRRNILGKNSSGAATENNGKMLSKSGKSTVVNVSGIEA